MGWYVTCEICGKEGKYGLWCNCYHEEMMHLLSLKKGCIIEDMFILDDFHLLMYEQLIPVGGQPEDRFYLVTCIKDGGSGEYACHRTMMAITANQFLKAKEITAMKALEALNTNETDDINGTDDTNEPVAEMTSQQPQTNLQQIEDKVLQKLNVAVKKLEQIDDLCEDEADEQILQKLMIALKKLDDLDYCPQNETDEQLLEKLNLALQKLRKQDGPQQDEPEEVILKKLKIALQKLQGLDGPEEDEPEEVILEKLNVSLKKLEETDDAPM